MTTAKTPHNLNLAVVSTCFSADIPEDDLVANIERMIRSLANVPTDNAFALVRVANEALLQAQLVSNPSARRAQLAIVSVWVGTIKVGWI